MSQIEIIKELIQGFGKKKFTFFFVASSSLAILDIFAIKVLTDTLQIGAESLSGSVSIGVSKNDFIIVAFFLIIKNLLSVFLIYYISLQIGKVEGKIAVRNYRSLEFKGRHIGSKYNLSFWINLLEKKPHIMTQISLAYIVIGSEIIGIIAICVAIFITLPKVIFIATPLIVIIFIIQQKMLSKQTYKEGMGVNSKYIETLNLIEDKHNVGDLIFLYKNTSFIENFTKIRTSLAVHRSLTNFWAIVPRYSLEILAIVVALLFGVTTYFLVGIDRVIPILIVIVTVALRITPAINRVQSSILVIQSLLPTINELNSIVNAELEKIKIQESGISLKKVSPINQELVNLHDVSFTDLSTEKKILNNISLSINKSKSYIVTGESGSGKTTLLKLMAGLEHPTSGQVNIYEASIGYVPQMFYPITGDIFQNVALNWSSTKLDREKINQSLIISEYMKISIGDNNIYNEQKFRNFSGGEGQRVSIARAIFADSNLIIFDEPTSALDSKKEKDIFKLILTLTKNKTIIVASHNQDYVRDFDYHIHIRKDGYIEMLSN
jgi:ABC-type bacteriocin/lantibiotic exporter with double-glycine peptidase domain